MCRRRKESVGVVAEEDGHFRPRVSRKIHAKELGASLINFNKHRVVHMAISDHTTEQHFESNVLR